jgi:hypothetical protein
MERRPEGICRNCRLRDRIFSHNSQGVAAPGKRQARPVTAMLQGGGNCRIAVPFLFFSGEFRFSVFEKVDNHIRINTKSLDRQIEYLN